MKKRFRIPIIGLICCLLLGTIAFAVNGRKITATYGGITIYLNGQKQVATDVNGKVVEPLSIRVRLMCRYVPSANGWVRRLHGRAAQVRFSSTILSFRTTKLQLLKM